MPGYIDPDPPKEEKLSSRPTTKNGQNDEAKRREQLRKEREARTYTNDTDVKKNARLSSVLAGGSASGPRADGMDDPFAAPTHVGTCPHCGITQNGLGRSGQMDKHYARECKMMNTCKNCLKVVLVPQLTDHYISRCEFVQGRMTHCNDCGLAIDKQDQARGSSHPLCRGRPPPSGAVWCPLCSIAVEDNPESWQKHCVSDCLGNPRQDGPQMDYQQYQDQARAYDDPPRVMTAAAAPRAMSSGRARTPTRSGSRKGSRPPSNGRPATNGKGSGTPNDGPRGVVESQEPVYVGRVIDADKLVAALSEIQEKKKKAKRQALKDAL
ncbi:hypothetical protein WR25_09735 [Diploscapter pachys]|uniref:Centrosomal protein CEP104 Zn finger domain-containing protein n=1 Tax=Diploscapter pachys TaxID=2018661 RepID=A0A2A2K368_9BILA|nr:hypothetical protein WR25_09735 [Diploscapter pachys]